MANFRQSTELKSINTVSPYAEKGNQFDSRDPLYNLFDHTDPILIRNWASESRWHRLISRCDSTESHCSTTTWNLGATEDDTSLLPSRPPTPPCREDPPIIVVDANPEPDAVSLQITNCVQRWSFWNWIEFQNAKRGGRHRLLRYLLKMRGGNKPQLIKQSWWQIAVWSSACFTVIAVLGLIDSVLAPLSAPVITPAFAAMVMILLLEQGWRANVAQPRNVFCGMTMSSLVAIIFRKAFTGIDIPWLWPPLGLGVSIALMVLTNTVHPPGGAIALLLIRTDTAMAHLDYSLMLSPVWSGTLITFIMALIMNNLSPSRKYPSHWF